MDVEFMERGGRFPSDMHRLWGLLVFPLRRIQ